MGSWGLPDSLAALAVFGISAGWLGRASWLCEPWSHFRPQYAALLLCAAALFAAAGRWDAAALSGALAALAGWSLRPLYRSTDRLAETPSAVLRVAVLNVFFLNRAYLKALAFLQRIHPDVVLLLESTQGWVDAAQAALPDYAHRVCAPREDGHGIALFSRLPLEASRVLPLGRAGFASVEAVVRVGGCRVTLLGTHPYSPLHPRHRVLRDEQLLEVARYASQRDTPVLVAGDLNVTSWSPIFRQMLRVGGLRDSREGFGIQPTWPAFLWRVFRIPIDHCLVSSEIAVHQRQVGPALGSDHLPVWLDCSVRAAATGRAGTGRP